MKPVAFMVMPFGTKETGQHKDGVPSEVDFDALWSKVYYPLLESQYTPVRADEDFGASIILDMIQRLAAADVVVADITIPNANVYYEVGVRHAARNGGCVLVAAEWSETPFDLAQIRRIPYPLDEGSVSDEVAQRALESLRGRIVDAATKGSSPVFEAVPDFPDYDPDKLQAFKDFAREMSDFHARVRSVSLSPPDQRRALANSLAEDHTGAISKGVALEIIQLLRDYAGWAETVAFVDSLDDAFLDEPEVAEQYWLAVSGKDADGHAIAAAKLEQLILNAGPTPERYGILGGRYKRLMRAAEERGDNAATAMLLSQAITAYQTGMQLDLNDYYCSSNLPRLLLQRGQDGDEPAAHRAAGITYAACERALERNEGDEWLWPTRLNVAFDAGDVAEARGLVQELQRQGHAEWKLDTLLDDLRASAKLHDPEVAAELNTLCDELEGWLSND